jgi:histidinol-phosphate aminotransferase
MQLDRRRWLQSLGLCIGSLKLSRVLSAQGSARPRVTGNAVHRARLSLNENPYGPSPLAVAAIQRELQNICRYTDAEFDGLVAAIGVAQSPCRSMRNSRTICRRSPPKSMTIHAPCSW